MELIGVLATHHVDYVVIGGFAAITHGSPRATRHLDIVAAPDNDNLARLLAALRDLQADRLLPDRPPHPVTTADVATLALGTTLHATTRAGALDVVGRPAGAPAYEQLAARPRYAASRRASISRSPARRSSARSSSLRVSGWVIPRRRLASRMPTGPSAPLTP